MQPLLQTHVPKKGEYHATQNIIHAFCFGANSLFATSSWKNYPKYQRKNGALNIVDIVCGDHLDRCENCETDLLKGRKALTH